jgi:hypothetical protein
MASMAKLKKALERGTGTSFSEEEVRVVGRVLYALGSAVLPSPAGREICQICGQPDHPPGGVGAHPYHIYQPGLLVPLIQPE